MTEPNGARDQKFRRQWTPSVICWFRILRLPRSKIVIELAVVKHCAGQTWLCLPSPSLGDRGQLCLVGTDFQNSQR